MSDSKFPPPRTPLPPAPPLPIVERPEGLTDQEWNDQEGVRIAEHVDQHEADHEAAYRKLAQDTWDGMSVDERLDWAAGHDLQFVEIDGRYYNVRTRTPRK